ncbi:GGDEF domain-containing protein [Cupriavidus taiwanensis]|uniref:GGDEF domain-containing protein n=1 Tax=Cupriavidus taiwanensis TaxID=164546 RepID=UPI000E100504|nr:GGDEF domain-containing protein [Cupriavidus taiwanensis]SOY68517.1 putative diguanylate cyclase, GGDEF domain [Cupriavidus taiwanensis]SOY69911.1 putative diguanylate cyclase, GGDEF domain [Cupriavidus taiwanensis]SOY95327.1 putative diguanylate cyclase, GGDEF domain [Cupriavidus taiwanensis]SOZ28398.1 putative diguanylate cyclase, GGDEF domain [Cupriavidus taiwanensis]SOZ71957.1 putative diguanylate cyclase, GGDEF domain [Cupriavidus taiwanensis]
MHLDQQTIAVVMMVFFCGTLIIAAGLVFALRASTAGRLWAFGHVLVSAAGLALAVSAASGTGQLGTLGAFAFVAGWLLIYRGVRVYYGVPAHPGALAGAGAIVLGLMAAFSGLPEGPQLVLRIVYGVLALVALATFATLARAGRGRRSIGAPLVLVASLVQLATQLAGFSHAMSLPPGATAAAPLTLFFAAPADSAWVLAPLIATLLGLFGFTVMAMEQIVAHNESGARIDALTGLLNRGALEMSALSLVARWQRDGQPLSCLVIDIDYFKQVNDSCGHHAGDAVLREVAQALDSSRRASDVAGRYGGEEFCVLCPHTDEQQASALANRVLRKVHGIALPAGRGHASVSIGVAQLRGGPGSREALWRTLFADADRALYHAKAHGRDRYVLASSMAEPAAGAAAAPLLQPAPDLAG